jgi:hypothetical protein
MLNFLTKNKKTLVVLFVFLSAIYLLPKMAQALGTDIKPFGGITHYLRNDGLHGHYPMLCCDGWVIEMDYVVKGSQFLFLPFVGAKTYQFHQELSNGAWILGLTEGDGTCYYGAYCRQTRGPYPKIKLVGSSMVTSY